MHEAIFTRGDVQGLPQELRKIINHPCNVVLRHHICPDRKHSHTPGHGSSNELYACIEHILQWEGDSLLTEYLFFVKQTAPVLAPGVTRALDIIKQITEQQENEKRLADFVRKFSYVSDQENHEYPKRVYLFALSWQRAEMWRVEHGLSSRRTVYVHDLEGIAGVGDGYFAFGDMGDPKDWLSNREFLQALWHLYALVDMGRMKPLSQYVPEEEEKNGG